MTQLEIPSVHRSPELGVLVDQAAKFLEAAKAGSTRQAYAANLVDFRRFPERHGLPFLPSTPETDSLLSRGDGRRPEMSEEPFPAPRADLIEEVCIRWQKSRRRSQYRSRIDGIHSESDEEETIGFRSMRHCLRL